METYITLIKYFLILFNNIKLIIYEKIIAQEKGQIQIIHLFVQKKYVVIFLFESILWDIFIL